MDSSTEDNGNSGSSKQSTLTPLPLPPPPPPPPHPCCGGCAVVGMKENGWHCSKCYTDYCLKIKKIADFDAAMAKRLSKLQFKTTKGSSDSDGDSNDDDPHVIKKPRVVKKSKWRSFMCCIKT